jgi:hypothetical protein
MAVNNTSIVATLKYICKAPIAQLIEFFPYELAINYLQSIRSLDV